MLVIRSMNLINQHILVTLCLCFKHVLMQNLSYEREFDLYDSEPE